MFVPYLLDVICILVSEFMTVYNYYQFVRTYIFWGSWRCVTLCIHMPNRYFYRSSNFKSVVIENSGSV